MSNRMGDRNLLAGILAWQRKFIGADVLVAAMNAWTLAKEKGLAQILREQKALTENQHALLEEAVHDHLARHGNDVQKTLAALRAVAPIKQELEHIADPDLQASLAHVGSANAPAAEAAVLVAELAEIAEAPKKTPQPIKADAKKNAAAKPRAQTPARGSSALVWLAGCALGGGFALLVGTLALGLAVVLLRDHPRFAQAKPDEPVDHGHPVDKGATKPPIEDPKDPDPLDIEPMPIEPMPIEPKPIEPKPAPPAFADGFVPLFNGEDLANWKQGTTRTRQWQIVNGILTGAGGDLNMLYTPRNDYGDFHLRAEVRMNEETTSSLMFRYPYGPSELDKAKGAGYVLRIMGKSIGNNRTGNLMINEKLGARYLPAPPNAIQAGEWFNLEIIANGEHVVTTLNGVESINHVYPKAHLLGGRIVLEALAAHGNARIEYRKIEIKEFKAVPAPPTPLPEQPLGDFVKFFNGKDLADWRLDGKGLWKVSDGEIVGQGPGALVSRRSDFRNCIVRVEVLPSPDVEAFFSFREHPDPEGRMPMKGLSSRLTGDGRMIRAGHSGINGSKGESGSLPNTYKANEWMTIEFRVRAESLMATTNGKSSAGLGFHPERFPPGAVGLHVIKGSVRIRRFEISSELTPGAAPPPLVVAAAKFVPLFNGKDLTGWKNDRPLPGAWRVENGVLIGTAPEKKLIRLHTEAKFKDFHLRAEVRSGDKNVAKIGVRSPDGALQGYNASIISLAPGGVRVGIINVQTDKKGFSLPRLVPEEQIPVGAWFQLDVIADGNRLIVLVNGKKTTDAIDASHAEPGFLTLTLLGQETLKFRKIEIGELRPAAPPIP